MIYVADQQTKLRIPKAKVRNLASRIVGKQNLSIAFVTNAEIRKLNRRFLRHDYATDVLSFRFDTDLLGEVVISTEYARAQAKQRGIPVEEELLRYVAHGILHLLGYNDHKPADRARMWKRQEGILKSFLWKPGTGRRTHGRSSGR